MYVALFLAFLGDVVVVGRVVLSLIQSGVKAQYYGSV